MTETREKRDLADPFDRVRHSLGITEIRKLCFILGGMYDLHPLPTDPSDGVHPTFQICPATFIRYLTVRLTDALRKDNVTILDVRLAGGAASHVINPTASDPHNALDKFNDLDFVFNLDIEGLDHAVAYDRIRDICVECLRQFAPQPVKSMSLTDFARVYVFKQMRIMCSKDEDNCWVLVSTNNTLGKTIDLLFVHKMRRRFIFPTDSFRIILEDSFLTMIQHARESVLSPSYANIASVAMHVQPPPISINTPTHIDIEQHRDSTPRHSGEAASNGLPESHVEHLAHISPSRMNGLSTPPPPVPTHDEKQVQPTRLGSPMPQQRSRSQSPSRASRNNRSPQKPQPEGDENTSQSTSAPPKHVTPRTPPTKSSSVPSASPTKTKRPGSRRKRRKKGKQKRNSQSQSRINETPQNKQRSERSAGSAPPETPHQSVSLHASRQRQLDQQRQARNVEPQQHSHPSSPAHCGEQPSQHRRGVSLDGVNDMNVNGLAILGDVDPFETRKAQSLPPTLESPETPPRAVMAPGRMGRYIHDDGSSTTMSVRTDSYYDDDVRSRRDSLTTTSSLSPGRSVCTSSSGMTQYLPENRHNPNWNSWVREGHHEIVDCLALHESYETALNDLRHQRIRFYRPEEVRGGGLLKYCELLQRKYTLCEDQQDRKTYYEQLILNRFVNIDYMDANEQRAAINNFLMRHFRNRTVEALHFLINIKSVVQQLQSISEQYEHSAHSLLEIVNTLESALREALQQHQSVRMYTPSNRNGATNASSMGSQNDATQHMVARHQAQQLYGMHHGMYPYSVYAAANAHHVAMGYPVFRSAIGMVAHPQPQYHYQHQHWGTRQYHQSAFISVSGLGSYGPYRQHRYEGDSKEDEVSRRRKHYRSNNHSRNGNHHERSRYNQSSRSRPNGGRHGNSQNY